MDDRTKELMREIESTAGLIKFGDEDEIRRSNDLMKREEEKYRRQGKRNEKIKSVLCAIFYPPLAIAFKAVAVTSKLIGCISAIGIPFGVYCVYKAVEQLKASVPLHEIKQVNFILLFIVLPIAAFAVNTAAEKLNDYFYNHA